MTGSMPVVDAITSSLLKVLSEESSGLVVECCYQVMCIKDRLKALAIDLSLSKDLHLHPIQVRSVSNPVSSGSSRFSLLPLFVDDTFSSIGRVPH